MRQTLKNALKRTPLYHPLRNRLLRRRHLTELTSWRQAGCPCPPPHVVKQEVLREYAGKYGLKVLVETGTYLGDMVEAMRDSFEQIFSIELSEELFTAARRRFAAAKHVEIVHGDSGIELGKIVGRIRQPTLFWLDGHYSGGVTARGDKDSPIYDELQHILSVPNWGHAILIDDARCFGTALGYPTIDDLRTYIESRKSDLDMIIRDDIVRLTPQ